MFCVREVNIISCDQICGCFLLSNILFSIATLNKLFIFAIRGRCRCRQLQQWIQKLNWLDSFTHKFNMHTCEGTVAVARWSERCSDVHSKCFICTTNLFKYTNEERTSNEKRGKVVACHRYGKTQSVTGCQWEHSYRSCCAQRKTIEWGKNRNDCNGFCLFSKWKMRRRTTNTTHDARSIKLYSWIFC